MMLAASDLSLFVERFINGLADGSIYALLALALVVIFRSTGQLNFAQGEIGTMAPGSGRPRSRSFSGTVMARLPPAESPIVAMWPGWTPWSSSHR